MHESEDEDSFSNGQGAQNAPAAVQIQNAQPLKKRTFACKTAKSAPSHTHTHTNARDEVNSERDSAELYADSDENSDSAGNMPPSAHQNADALPKVAEQCEAPSNQARESSKNISEIEIVPSKREKMEVEDVFVLQAPINDHQREVQTATVAARANPVSAGPSHAERALLQSAMRARAAEAEREQVYRQHFEGVTFFHSGNVYQPIARSELFDESDSEDEGTAYKLKIAQENICLNDIQDIVPRDKAFYALWNTHIKTWRMRASMAHEPLFQSEFVHVLDAFTAEHREVLATDLYHNYYLHLTVLLHNGNIDTDKMKSILRSLSDF